MRSAATQEAITILEADLSAVQGKGTFLAAIAQDVEHHISMEIFSSTTAFWKSQGKLFWVFFA